MAIPTPPGEGRRVGHTIGRRRQSPLLWMLLALALAALSLAMGYWLGRMA